MKKFFIFLTIFLFSFRCWSTEVEEIDIIHWSSQLGLPSNSIICFEQDNKGFMWIGTSNGLVRFDGYNFIIISLDDEINEEHIQRLLFKGIYLFVLNYNNEIYRINVNDFSRSKVIPNMIEDKELKNSLLQFRDGESELFNKSVPELSALRRNEISEDKNGRVWFINKNEGISFWDNETNNVFSIKNIRNYIYFKEAYEVFLTLNDLDLTSLFLDKTGNLWIGTASNGMFRIRFKEIKFQFHQFDYRPTKGLSAEDISEV